MQVIDPPQAADLEVIELEECEGSQIEATALEIAEQEAQRPFDLIEGPLWRLHLLRVSNQEHYFVINIHHIASDGWSTGVMSRELGAAYGAFAQGQAPKFPKITIQYADYAVWHRKWIQDKALKDQLTYWKEKLADLPTLDLPTDRQRRDLSSNPGARIYVDLPKPLIKALEKIAHSEGATLFMTLLTAFKVLLHRYSGQEDIVVGTPIAGRGKTELEGLIGFFVNTLVIRDDLSDNPGFRELLNRIKESSLEAYTHQDIPFEKLVEELSPERDLSRNPLFQVMFILQNAPNNPLELQEMEVTRIPVKRLSAKFDLKLAIGETDNGIRASWEYSTQLFDRATIERMAQHFINLLSAIVSEPNKPIGQLPLLSLDEQQQLLSEWNDIPSRPFDNVCIHQRFEDQVKRTPNAVAVIFGPQELTYAELNRRANQLANHLLSLQLGPAVRVAVSLNRSTELLVGLLGILKAGAVYVPIEPTYPQERIAFILKDTEAPIIITQQALIQKFPNYEGTTLCLDRDWSKISSHSDRTPACKASTNSLAYIIYTSGSTGTPKGILLPHITLVNLLSQKMSTKQGDRVVQFTSISFDVSLQEIFHALLHGNTLVIVNDETRLRPDNFARFILENSITDLFVPNIVLQYLVEAVVESNLHLPSLSNVHQAGEALTISSSVRRFFKTHPSCRLHNHYGPAESHVVTAYALPADVNKWPNKPPIGRPISNTRIYILDTYRNLLPAGIQGELCISGVGLGKGYLNRKDLTAEKFIADPFLEQSGVTMYRTGDLVRQAPDGNIEFIGRIDHQVKIRGFRIELGEIEAVISQHSDVNECVVIAHSNNKKEKSLTAFIVGQNLNSSQVDSIRPWLEEKLPGYMIPSSFVKLEALPLTKNGKIDRKELESMIHQSVASENSYVAPRSELELRLVRIWRKVLNQDRIGIQDNYFSLGGHSMKAVHMATEIESLLGIQLPIAVLFKAPTIKALAQWLTDESWKPEWHALVPLQPKGSKPPLFIVHGWGGDVYSFVELAQELPMSQSVYGLQAVGLDGRMPRHTTVEQMASFYVNEMRSFQKEGPYYLLGYSMGGCIAYEIAQQLNREGQRVAFLGLLDSSPTGRLPWTIFFRRLFPMLISRSAFHFNQYWKTPHRKRRHYLIEPWKTLKIRLSSNFRKEPILPETKPEKNNAFPNPEGGDYYQSVLNRYKMQKYPGQADIFVCDSVKPWRISSWKQLIHEGATIHRVQGNHLELLTAPVVSTTAKTLWSVLQSTQEKEQNNP